MATTIAMVAAVEHTYEILRSEQFCSWGAVHGKLDAGIDNCRKRPLALIAAIQVEAINHIDDSEPKWLVQYCTLLSRLIS